MEERNRKLSGLPHAHELVQIVESYLLDASHVGGLMWRHPPPLRSHHLHVLPFVLALSLASSGFREETMRHCTITKVLGERAT